MKQTFEAKFQEVKQDIYSSKWIRLFVKLSNYTCGYYIYPKKKKEKKNLQKLVRSNFTPFYLFIYLFIFLQSH